MGLEPTSYNYRVEKDKAAMQREIEELHSALDSESKQRQNADKMAKQVELQLTDMQCKSDEQVCMI